MSRKTTPTVVLLDTNFLFLPIQFGVNLEAEFKIALPELHILELPQCVKRELQRLQEKGEQAKLVKFAFDYLGTLSLSEFPDPGGEVDGCILNEAIERNAIIATNDRGLISRARKHDLRIARLYSKSHIRIT